MPAIDLCCSKHKIYFHKMLLRYWAQLLKGKTVIAFALIDFRVSSDHFSLESDNFVRGRFSATPKLPHSFILCAVIFFLSVGNNKRKTLKSGLEWRYPTVRPNWKAKHKPILNSTSSASNLNWIFLLHKPLWKQQIILICKLKPY